MNALFVADPSAGTVYARPDDISDMVRKSLERSGVCLR